MFKEIGVQLTAGKVQTGVQKQQTLRAVQPEVIQGSNALSQGKLFVRVIHLISPFRHCYSSEKQDTPCFKGTSLHKKSIPMIGHVLRLKKNFLTQREKATSS